MLEPKKSRDHIVIKSGGSHHQNRGIRMKHVYCLFLNTKEDCVYTYFDRFSFSYTYEYS